MGNIITLQVRRKIRVILTPALIGKFWSNIERPALNACWLWTGGRTDRGYGAFNLPGFGMIGAHRLIQAFKTGALELGAHVRHRCDNPPCCNPWHVIGGTQKQNVQDSILRGQFTRTRRTRIPRANKQAIAAAVLAGVPRLEVARRFKVSHRQVYRIAAKISLTANNQLAGGRRVFP